MCVCVCERAIPLNDNKLTKHYTEAISVHTENIEDETCAKYKVKRL